MEKEELIQYCLKSIITSGYTEFTPPENNFFSKNFQFVKFFYDHLTERHLQAFPPQQETGSRKEIILELLLTKFDCLTPYKPSCTFLKDQAFKDTLFGRTILRYDYIFLKKIWMAHQLNGQSLIRDLQFHSIFLFSWGMFFTWLSDPTPDLSKTTVFADRALSLGDRLFKNYS